ncbi:MAG: hypothetical protein SPI30_00170 [Prevotella sp.]|nr:hypothetical protein [Prevotella sp.]
MDCRVVESVAGYDEKSGRQDADKRAEKGRKHHNQLGTQALAV